MALPGWETLRRAGHWRWVLTAGVGLLVLVGLGVGGWSWYQAAEARAAEAVAEAVALAQEALAPQGTAVQRDAAAQQLEAVITQYPSRRIVPEAAYHLGNIRYESRAWEAARAAYALALAKGAQGSLAALSRLGIGYSWEAQGKFQEALGAYQEALRGVPAGHFLFEELLMDVARAQELSGKPDQAIETYRRILREVSQSRRADDIRSRLATLESPPPR